MSDIIFFSRVIPDEIKDEVQKKRKKTMSESGESLQWKIIEGMNKYLENKITVLNYMPVQSWPKSYPDIYVKGGIYHHNDGTIIRNLPFNNIAIVKRLFMGRSLYKFIKGWAGQRKNEDKIIISYSLTPEFLHAIRIAKKKNNNIKAMAIVADLPEYTILEKRISLLTRIYLKWMKAKTDSNLYLIDSFVFLTRQMADRLAKKSQKFIVMEGIASNDMPSSSPCKEKYIFYAGTLHERFGISKLMEAFQSVKSQDVKLVLCGIGDYINEIKQYAKIDSRVIYKGQISRDEVLKLMVNATIIVNPRCDNEEFTKYSFPSKNLEALSSGKPFIGYKLAGIPDEYDQFICYPKDNSTISLSEKIHDVLNNYQFYCSKAIKAKKWVLDEKSKEAQGKKILDLINCKSE